MQGRFNVENALAAIVVAKQIGVSDEDIAYGIENGVYERSINQWILFNYGYYRQIRDSAGEYWVELDSAQYATTYTSFDDFLFIGDSQTKALSSRFASIFLI